MTAKFNTTNPATGEVLKEFPTASDEEISAVIDASDAAFQTWRTTDVRGRDLVTGLPKTMEVSAKDVSTALQDVVENIIGAIKGTLEETTPEIAADVIDHGIVLTGGGALLKHLPDVIADATKVPVFIANDPLDCVAIGTGESLKSIDVMKK